MIMDILTLDAENIKSGLDDSDLGQICCVFCEESFEKGEVFKDGARYFDAEAMARRHISQVHGGTLERLLTFDKHLTGLTDNQKALLRMMADGLSDQDIAGVTGTTTATVRHQRFNFREKAKQAKLYLCMYELAFGDRKQMRSQPESRGTDLADIHEGAKMVDERYVITKAEEEEIAANLFSSRSPLRLKTLSSKEKKKIVILKIVAAQFERGKRYSEKELNAILKEIYDDFASIRRYLVEYGYMDRTDDCSAYWLK